MTRRPTANHVTLPNTPHPMDSLTWPNSTALQHMYRYGHAPKTDHLPHNERGAFHFLDLDVPMWGGGVDWGPLKGPIISMQVPVRWHSAPLEMGAAAYACRHNRAPWKHDESRR